MSSSERILPPCPVSDTHYGSGLPCQGSQGHEGPHYYGGATWPDGEPNGSLGCAHCRRRACDGCGIKSGRDFERARVLALGERMLQGLYRDHGACMAADSLSMFLDVVKGPDHA